MAHRGCGTRVCTGSVFLLCGTAVLAQVYPGGYPGQYPGGYPGQYPGSRGPSIPIPGRKSKDKPAKDSGQPLPNFRGKLKQMDAKSITIELGDYRQLEFRRNDKTKFFKNGEELKTPKFNPGDQVSVEGPEEADGSLTAVNVYWEKAADAESTASGKQKDDSVVDTWKDDPKDKDKAAPATAAATTEASAEKAPPPSKADPDDPGPPKLTRGRVDDPKREKASEPPAETASNRIPQPAIERPVAAPAPGSEPSGPPPVLRRSNDEDNIPVTRRTEDQLIRRAADAALDFTETLPSYVCQEVMSRFQSESRPANWQPMDVISMNLVYENGREDYRDLAVNGKPVKKKMEDIGGAWSTGEFGTVLIDLFSPATAAEFRYQRDSRSGGVSAKLYDFQVTRERSHWSIHMTGQSYNPAYRGSVWIDPQTARVLRIEMQAYGFPDAFPTDHVESATDYQYTRLGDAKQYLLPVHAETLSCQRGSSYCSRNTIDFRNYHKYTGETSITYGEPQSDGKSEKKK